MQKQNTFKFQPSQWIPFRDQEECERIRNIKREDFDKHPNPDVTIKVVRDKQVPIIHITDMLNRIKAASEDNRDIAFITGNPNPGYSHLAHMLNELKIDCRHLYIINWDEWADEDGNTAPESYPQGFMHAMKKYFYSNLDEKIRPPEEQIMGPTTENINDIGKFIEDKFGGVDVCYSGSGWTGHLGFIDPDTPEFQASLDEWKEMGPRIVTLNPFTIAQNSLHPSFGRCGDMAFVPPKAATLGPAQALGAKHRMDFSTITIGGSETSWQRFISRLVIHGPVTPQIPGSILQTVPTDFYVSETIASDIKPVWYESY
ncbi:MAG: hypothetical protein ACOCQP_02275 [Lentisphaeria bacterium]